MTDINEETWADYKKLGKRLEAAGAVLSDEDGYTCCELKRGDAALIIDLYPDGGEYPVNLMQYGAEPLELGLLSFDDICHLARIVLGVVL